MSILKTIALFTCTILVYCDADYVDTLPKCGLVDSKCHAELIENVLQNTGSTGIPEVPIPVYDPLNVKNISVTVLGLLSFKLKEGFVKGVKDCKVLSVKTDIKTGEATVELLCDIFIEGKYRVEGAGPQIQVLFGNGNNVEGEGNVKLQIEKLYVRLEIAYNIVKQDDGQTHFNSSMDFKNYQYDVRGKGSINVDNIYLGKQESSALISGVLNENFKFVIKSFGKPFVDKALEIADSLLGDFFRAVPTSKIINEDLTEYL